MVRSTNTSKKLENAKFLESVRVESNADTSVISDCGLVGQPIGPPAKNDPLGQISAVAIAAPSPVAVEPPSVNIALRRAAADTSKWKNDSNSSSAAADLLSVNWSEGVNVVPLGVTCT